MPSNSRCREFEERMGRLPREQGEAERLRLERHLDECAECRQLLALSRSASVVLTEGAVELSAAARARVLERAFAGAAARPVVRASGPSRRWLLAGGAVLSAAAVLLLWWHGGVRAPEPQAVGPMATRAPEGELRQAEPSVQAPASAGVEAPASPASEPRPDQGAALAADTRIEADRAGERAFAHARVRFDAGTRLSFSAAESVLTLEHGRVQVDVDPSVGRRFAVHTQRFRVEVLGTRFEVTPERVRVQQGHVQIAAHDGRVLARDLGAGTEFSLPAPAPAVDSRQLIERARAALNRGDSRGAAQLLERVVPRNLPRAEQAEAAMLGAELAMIERNFVEAMRRYQEVARRFRGLPAAENAAFAAAQVAGRALPAQELPLLRKYLALYPRGRFAEDARARLSAAGTKP
jgi:hypothetical protein